MKDKFNGLSRDIKTIFLIGLFTFVLFGNLYPAAIQCVWTGVEKIVAVGDIHGDYNSFVKILRGTRIVDKDLHWSGGKTHLVQIGDIMDRGDDAKEIFDLLIRLEQEAEEAGGKVHMLLGNHEEMNITGIAFGYKDYVTLKQFLSFLPVKFREKEERKIRRGTKKGSLEAYLDYPLDKDLMDHWEKIRQKAIKDPNEPARREYTKNFNEKYGKWLLQKNAVIKINDVIFVHGGISERYSRWKLEDINERLRLELLSLIRGFPIDRQIVYDPDGPLWYRDLAQPQIKDEDLKTEADRILQNLGARYMVIAHTPRLIRSKDDMKRFGGRIWVIDTGIGEAYRSMGGRPTALIIENGDKFSVWPFDFGDESSSPEEQGRYFQDRIVSAFPCLRADPGFFLRKTSDERAFINWG